MENEELAVAIQGGDTSKVIVLWDQVCRFVSMKARQRIALANNPRIEQEDLEQAGFLAMMDAVRRFDPLLGVSFLTLLNLTLKTAFDQAAGYRTERQKLDPIHRAASLYTPLSDEADADKRINIMPDPGDEIADADHRIWVEQLHDALEKALNDLPPEEGSTLRRMFYDEESMTKIADDSGVTLHDVQKRRDRGLKAIRKRRRQYHLDEYADEVRSYVDSRTPWFLSVGVEAYGRTHTSAPELLAIKRDSMERQYLHDIELRRAAQEVQAETRVDHYGGTENNTALVATASDGQTSGKGF